MLLIILSISSTCFSFREKVSCFSLEVSYDVTWKNELSDASGNMLIFSTSTANCLVANRKAGLNTKYTVKQLLKPFVPAPLSSSEENIPQKSKTRKLQVLLTQYILSY